MSNADWRNNHSSNSTEQAFIDEFIRAGLIQLINQPTLIRGNIFDILLTNSENTVDIIAIEHTSGICKSDHYTIFFDIKPNIRRKKPMKIKVFNYKRADWEHLSVMRSAEKRRGYIKNLRELSLARRTKIWGL